MTKNDIVIRISKETGRPYKEVRRIVQRTLDSVAEAVLSEGRIELRNFGVFEVKSRAARKARNPRTGAEVLVPPKKVVVFKPGRTMEERIK